jgi:hypothetical protein
VGVLWIRKRPRSNLGQFQGRTQTEGGGGERAAGVQPPKTPKDQNLKSPNFVDILMSEVLRDFLFSRNQPLRSADD